MIKNPTTEQEKSVKVNVILRGEYGKEYLGRDIPQDPCVFKGMFTFWAEEDCLLSIPLDLIAKVDMYFD